LTILAIAIAMGLTRPLNNFNMHPLLYGPLRVIKRSGTVLTIPGTGVYAE
jgi:hypothetical protein